jgi:hypothetical protein
MGRHSTEAWNSETYWSRWQVDDFLTVRERLERRVERNRTAACRQARTGPLKPGKHYCEPVMVARHAAT